MEGSLCLITYDLDPGRDRLPLLAANPSTSSSCISGGEPNCLGQPWIPMLPIHPKTRAHEDSEWPRDDFDIVIEAMLEALYKKEGGPAWTIKVSN
uniref:Uncharacterized protein n=1 Tax=Sphaerodactylus townsendi TaxID=933632 RepID=A0ACB8EWR1_9SAUR